MFLGCFVVVVAFALVSADEGAVGDARDEDHLVNLGARDGSVERRDRAALPTMARDPVAPLARAGAVRGAATRRASLQTRAPLEAPRAPRGEVRGEEVRRERRGAQGQLAAREVPRRAKAPPATADVVHRHLQTERSETPVQTLQVGIVSRAHGVWPRGPAAHPLVSIDTRSRGAAIVSCLRGARELIHFVGSAASHTRRRGAGSVGATTRLDAAHRYRRFETRALAASSTGVAARDGNVPVSGPRPSSGSR